MKPIRPFVCLPLLFLFATAHAQEPEIGEGRVTIPYPELKALLDVVEEATKAKPEAVPPIDATLSVARYQLDFSAGVPSLTADFEIDAFTDDWHSVPLFGGDLRLETATLPSGESSVIRKDDAYALLAKGKGRFKASLTLSLPADEAWEKSAGLVVEPAAAAVGELRVIGGPEGKALRIEGVKPLTASDGALVYPLPKNKEPWKIALEEDPDPSSSEAVPSAWVLHSQILLRYGDGRLRYAARVQAQADSGSGMTMALALPANATGVSVEGEDLDDWKLEPRTGESRILRIGWETRDLLDRTLLLNWEVPQSPLSDQWDLSAPRLQPADGIAAPAESRALVAVVSVEGLELTHPSLQGRIESQRLPEWMRAQLGDEDAVTAEIVGDAPLSLAAAWLPRLETAQATISTASFETRLVADGSTLVTADFTVQHAAPIVWKLELPAVDEILACTIDGREARPIRRSATEIEFRLAAPAAAENGSPATKVGLSYSLKADRLDPVSGRVALELPLTSLFIHRLTWELTIPEGYEPTAVEGNVRLSTEPSEKGSASHLIHLVKELCRDERPAVEIHYQRTDLSSES